MANSSIPGNTHYLRVFTDNNGNHGDAASVIIDEGRHISDEKRQKIARKLHTGETIFVNNLANADISVVHPQGEIGFAGVGVLATAWLLAELRGKPTATMHARDGDLKTWQADGVTWARAGLSIMPPWNYKQLDSPEAVEQIKLEDTKDWLHTMAWAWIDEAKGLIRARTFANDWDIPEAQGNGSGSMVLAAQLGKTIEIKHGEGSVIFAEPGGEGEASIGGRVCRQKMHAVPFVENLDDRCVVSVVGMVLAHFMPERKFTMSELEELCGYIKGRGTWKALSMLNLAKLGLQVHWIEDFDHERFVANPQAYLREILEDEAYEYQITNTDLQLEAERMRQYIEGGLPLERRKATNEDIKRCLDDGWLVHLEVNANTIAGEPGYEGHSILVIGYDEDGVTIHNPDGTHGNKPSQHVSWELLDQAWKEFGGSYSLYAFKITHFMLTPT